MAKTLKVAVPPLLIVMLTGCVLISGAVPAKAKVVTNPSGVTLRKTALAVSAT